ncbi:hypothetical protein AOLI_G00232210 [Acnodon oligacanthus]
MRRRLDGDTRTPPPEITQAAVNCFELIVSSFRLLKFRRESEQEREEAMHHHLSLSLSHGVDELVAPKLRATAKSSLALYMRLIGFRTQRLEEKATLAHCEHKTERLLSGRIPGWQVEEGKGPRHEEPQGRRVKQTACGPRPRLGLWGWDIPAW